MTQATPQSSGGLVERSMQVGNSFPQDTAPDHNRKESGGGKSFQREGERRDLNPRPLEPQSKIGGGRKPLKYGFIP